MPPEYREPGLVAANEQVRPKKHEVRYIFLGLLNLVISVPVGYMGIFAIGFSGDSPNTTDAMIYTIFLVALGLPFYFFLSSIALFYHFFRRTPMDTMVLVVYMVIPWAILALISITMFTGT